MRRFLAALLAVVLLAVALRRARRVRRRARDPHQGPAQAAPTTPTPTGTATPTSVPVPTVDAAAQPLQPASAGAPIPAPAALAKVLAAAVADPALRPGPGVVVRDAFTGQTLFSKGANTPRVPASTAKLLTALAVGTTLDPLTTLPTRVVQGAGPDQVVLVAGGDTMLARGKGSPTAVEGRAGLGDLAAQVAAAPAGRRHHEGHASGWTPPTPRGRAGRPAGARPTSTPASPAGCRCSGLAGPARGAVPPGAPQPRGGHRRGVRRRPGQGRHHRDAHPREHLVHAGPRRRHRARAGRVGAGRRPPRARPRRQRQRPHRGPGAPGRGEGGERGHLRRRRSRS